MLICNGLYYYLTPRRNCFHSSGVTKPNVLGTSKSLLTQYIHSCYYYARHHKSVGHLQLHESFFSNSNSKNNTNDFNIQQMI